MARVGEKVNDLVAEEEGMEPAIRTVLDEDGSGTVEWADVEGELTSGQWGRLIEKGILTSADGDGFEIRDREAVRIALDGEDYDETDGGEAEEEGPDSSWTTYDKLAGLGALVMFAGYSFGPVRDVIGSTIDLILGPLDSLLPFYVVVLVLAMGTGLYSSLLQANLMDMEKMQYYQERMSDIREREQEAKERGDDEALEEIREEQMQAAGENLGMFKEQFRPMAWIMLLTIPAFLWMYWMILDGHVAELERSITMPLLGSVEWQQGVIGPVQAWLLWYFVCSLGFTQLIRKALNIETSPTGT
jgi:uncharacterized membrane protein (DUF106 family)